MQLKKEAVYVFRVRATSASLSDLHIPALHRVFAPEQAKRKMVSFNFKGTTKKKSEILIA